MSRRRKPNGYVRGLQAQCADAMEPLWRPAPHIRGRRTPPELQAQHHADARRAAFAWLSRKVGAVIEDFDAVRDTQVLNRCIAALEDATIYTVERDPAFASTPYGAAMIAHWKARQDAWRAEFGDAARFNDHQRDRQRQAREARSQ